MITEDSEWWMHLFLSAIIISFFSIFSFILLILWESCAIYFDNIHTHLLPDPPLTSLSIRLCVLLLLYILNSWRSSSHGWRNCGKETGKQVLCLVYWVRGTAGTPPRRCPWSHTGEENAWWEGLEIPTRFTRFNKFCLRTLKERRRFTTNKSGNPNGQFPSAPKHLVHEQDCSQDSFWVPGDVSSSIKPDFVLGSEVNYEIKRIDSVRLHVSSLFRPKELAPHQTDK